MLKEDNHFPNSYLILYVPTTAKSLQSPKIYKSGDFELSNSIFYVYNPMQ